MSVSVLLTKRHSGVSIEEDDKDGVYGTDETEEKCAQGTGGET